MDSKYKKAFERLTAEGKGLFRLRGANMIVEVLPQEEIKSKGGLIIANASATHKATAQDSRRPLGLILAIGEGWEDAELELKVGQVILMPYAPMYLSEFPGLKEFTTNTLAIVSENDVLFLYESLEAFAKARELLNVE